MTAASVHPRYGRPPRPWIVRAVFIGLFWAGSAAAADPCLECHGIAGLGTEGHPVWVDARALTVGAHGGLTCSDCHKGGDAYPHSGSMKVRCDLPCHVVGASHEGLTQGETRGVHAGIADPSCLGCHTGRVFASPRDVDDLCRSCHPGLDRDRAIYPDTPGAFGWRGHRDPAAGRRMPRCPDCHGVHGVATGRAARRSCGADGCHPGKGEDFGRFFDHGGPARAAGWNGAGRAVTWITGAVGAILLLHCLRGSS